MILQLAPTSPKHNDSVSQNSAICNVGDTMICNKYVSYKEIGDAVNLSKNTVSKYVAKLEDRLLIERLDGSLVSELQKAKSPSKHSDVL